MYRVVEQQPPNKPKAPDTCRSCQGLWQKKNNKHQRTCVSMRDSVISKNMTITALLHSTNRCTYIITKLLLPQKPQLWQSADASGKPILTGDGTTAHQQLHG